MDFNISFAVLIAAIAGAGIYVSVLFKNNKKKEIYSIVKSLVDEAERKFGNGTGEIKYTYVSTNIHKALPTYVKLFLSEELLDSWIEKAVDELQEVLKKKIEEAK